MVHGSERRECCAEPYSWGTEEAQGNTGVCVCVSVYVYMCLCVSACVSVCEDLGVSVYLCMSVHLCVCVFMCVYLSVCVSVHLYVCLCVCVCACLSYLCLWTSFLLLILLSLLEFFDAEGSDIDLNFGGLRGRGVQKQDPPIERDLYLSLEDLFFGCTKKIKISRRVSTLAPLSRHHLPLQTSCRSLAP